MTIQNKPLAEKIRKGLQIFNKLKLSEEPKVWGVEKFIRRGDQSYGANVVGLALLGSGCPLVTAAMLCKRATDKTATQEDRDQAKDEILRMIDVEEGECEILAQRNLTMRSTEIAYHLDKGDLHVDAA